MKPLKLILPAHWIELSNRQLVFVSRLWIAGYPEPEFLVKAFLMLTGLKLIAHSPGRPLSPSPRLPVSPSTLLYSHSSIKKPFLIDTDLLSELCEKCRFLLTPDEVNPVRRIGFARVRHFRMYNATFEEYLMTENYYFAYTETKKEEYLDNLIACLYRKPWQRWNAGKIQDRAKAFSKIDPALKNAVFMGYIGFRSYVPKRCKALFSVKGTASGRPFNPREYINGMIHTLSNGDITIKDKLLSRPCWDALDELEQRALEHQSINK